MRFTRYRFISFYILILFTLIAALIWLIIAPTQPTDSITVPSLYISLNDTTLTEIENNHKDYKYPGNSLSLITKNDTFTYSNVEIKLRGNSTWGMPKNPFQIKFSSRTSLLDMSSAKKWILLANFLDKSNLRSAAAFYLEYMLNDPYAIEGEFVELYIDNEYHGLYYLTEKVEVGQGRVKLTDPFGIIAEIENLHSAEENCYRSIYDTCLVVHDLVANANESDAMSSFLKSYNQLEVAAKEHDYDAVKTLIDLESFARYYLLSEFSVNPDAYTSSCFLYKDGASDIIHAGPGWDFDLAFGNHIWMWPRTADYYLPETDDVMKKYAFGGLVYDEATHESTTISADPSIAKLFYWLSDIPEFQELTRDLYRKTLLGRKTELMSHLTMISDTIYEAALRDKEYWRNTDTDLYAIFGIHYDPNDESTDIIHSALPATTAYDLELSSLFDWLERRFDALDRKYGSIDNTIIKVI
ncbi:CotH kinase family protein [Candidatus Saccharibacteria bacterium]|nr:CotH kinase family protein [Candidatus Saccharibacteria bacterium]